MISGDQWGFVLLTPLLPNIPKHDLLISARAHGSIAFGHLLCCAGNPDPPPPPWCAVLDALVSCGLHNLANPQNSTSPQLLILLKPDSLLVTETQGFNFIFFPPQRLFKLQCPPFLEARKWSSEHICQCHEHNLSESVFAWASVYDRGLLDKTSSSQQAERRVFLLDCLSLTHQPAP